MKVEYRVIPVTRYIVTRHFDGMETESPPGTPVVRSGGCSVKGEFDSHDVAYQVGYALAKEEHQRLGYPVGDERIKYPDMLPAAISPVSENGTAEQRPNTTAA